MLPDLVEAMRGMLAGAAAGAVAPGPASHAAATALINSYDRVRNLRAPLVSALKEIRQGKALDFHRNRTAGRTLEPLLAELGLADDDRAARQLDWDWFLTKGPPASKARASDAEWAARTSAFQDALIGLAETRLARFNPDNIIQRDPAFNWLQNLPPAVHDLIHDVAHADVPPAFVYAAAANEGMVDEYLRRQVSAGFRLSAADLGRIRVDRPVDGFLALGIDTFFTELEFTHLPLRSFFQAGFDLTKMVEIRRTNEQGVEVRSARAPNLKMGLQALVAMLRRRRALFLEDQVSLKYAAPSAHETVYFAYTYYNAGPGTRANPNSPGDGGYQTLYRHRPDHPDPAQRRKLGDWIDRREYRNSMKVLITYRFVSDGSGGHPVIFAGL